MATERKVRPMVTTPEDLEALIGQLSRLIDSVDEVDMATEREEDLEPEIELRESADEAPVVKLVHSVIADAVKRGTSDIHLDPSDGDLRVRFRVDGVVDRLGDRPEAARDRADLADQDHGQPRHRRAPGAAGRAHRADASTAASSTSASRRCR